MAIALASSEITTVSPPVGMHHRGMRFSPNRLTRPAAIATVAIMLWAAGALAACSGSTNKSCGEPTTGASSMRLLAASACPISGADDFICSGGTECHPEIHRPACDINPCPEARFTYSVKAITASEGEHFVSIESGRGVMPAGASTTTIPIRTFPSRVTRPVTILLEISVDGKVVDTATGTIMPQ